MFPFMPEHKVGYLSGMQVSLDNPKGINRFSAYSARELTINDRRYSTSAIVTADTIIEEPQLESLLALGPEVIERVLALAPDVVLLGTGATHEFPPAEVAARFLSAGVGVEAMDSRAACRTFNVLVGEGRRVAAIIIL
jgi:uncharacterized protein